MSTLNLFKNILDEQRSLPRDQPHKDLVNIINFLLRRFFKALAEEPFLAVEVYSLFKNQPVTSDDLSVRPFTLKTEITGNNIHPGNLKQKSKRRGEARLWKTRAFPLMFKSRKDTRGANSLVLLLLHLWRVARAN